MRLLFLLGFLFVISTVSCFIHEELAEKRKYFLAKKARKFSSWRAAVAPPAPAPAPAPASASAQAPIPAPAPASGSASASAAPEYTAIGPLPVYKVHKYSGLNVRPVTLITVTPESSPVAVSWVNQPIAPSPSAQYGTPGVSFAPQWSSLQYQWTPQEPLRVEEPADFQSDYISKFLKKDKPIWSSLKKLPASMTSFFRPAEPVTPIFNHESLPVPELPSVQLPLKNPDYLPVAGSPYIAYNYPTPNWEYGVPQYPSQDAYKNPISITYDNDAAPSENIPVVANDTQVDFAEEPKLTAGQREGEEAQGQQRNRPNLTSTDSAIRL